MRGPAGLPLPGLTSWQLTLTDGDTWKGTGAESVTPIGNCPSPGSGGFQAWILAPWLGSPQKDVPEGLTTTPHMCLPLAQPLPLA